MSTQLRELGSTLGFNTSDSRTVVRRFLGRFLPDRTGYNNQNTYWVTGAGRLDQAPRFLKADGAGSMTPMRSRQDDRWVSPVDYFRVAGGVS